MLDAGGGGGGGPITPWYSYDVARMWQIVDGQNTDALWTQASGWKKTAELTSLHLYNLKEYKAQLAEAWPPERSQASAAYMAELDKLITSVQETHDAASANHDAVVNLALAAGDAKYKLKPIWDEYQSNAQRLADYNQRVAAYDSDATAMPQPAPGRPPVPDGRQEELNSQARSIMYGISSEITTAGAALKPPKPYVAPMPKVDVSTDPPDGGGGGAGPMLVPPMIPPVMPAPPPPAPVASPPLVPAATPPTAPPGFGPVLGGTPTPVLPGPPVTSPPVIQPPAPLGQPGLPMLPPGGPIGPTPPPGYGPGPGLPPKAGLPPTGLVNGIGGPGPKGPGGRFLRAAMPPGGVIGGPPGAGLARPGPGGPVSRVNPPGGMIGQPGLGRGATAGRPGGAVRPGAGGRPIDAPGTHAAGGGRAAGLPVGRAGRQRDEDGPVRHWDPDNPWETEEGVAPVVLPPEKPKRHDPGPAIGQGR